MARENPAISVVVATRNREARLRRLLAALRAQTLSPDSFEVIVVDDGADGRTATLLAASAADSEPQLRTARSDVSGPAAARNVGWQIALAPLIAFTDDDCEPTPAWLERALASCATHPGQIVQGLTRPIASEVRAGVPFQRSKLIEAASPFFQTCNIVYPRTVLEQLGGFDQRFSGPAGEDADLGWRALGAGFERVFDASLVVEHAVEERSAAAFIAEGLRGWEVAHAYRQHPGLRVEASYLGIFWARSHARILAAAAGVALSSRQPLALALALPYAKGLVARTRVEGPAWAAAAIVARDGAELLKAARGSLAARILML